MTLLLKVCWLEPPRDGSGVDHMTPESGLAIHSTREIGISR